MEEDPWLFLSKNWHKPKSVWQRCERPALLCRPGTTAARLASWCGSAPAWSWRFRPSWPSAWLGPPRRTWPRLRSARPARACTGRRWTPTCTCRRCCKGCLAPKIGWLSASAPQAAARAVRQKPPRPARTAARAVAQARALRGDRAWTKKRAKGARLAFFSFTIPTHLAPVAAIFVGCLQPWSATRLRVTPLSRYTLSPGIEAFIAQRLALADRPADVADAPRSDGDDIAVDRQQHCSNRPATEVTRV